MNQSGAVVGVEYNLGTLDPRTFGIPFVYTQAAGMQAIPSPLPYWPNQAYGYATSINDAGLIVGAVNGGPYSNEPPTAFLSNGQQSWDLNTLIAPGSGFLLTSAVDIDDSGRIIAQASDAQGQEHNVLLTPLATPAPEPASWLLMATGGLALGWRRLTGRGRPDRDGSPGT